jgi:glycerol-3-phosphate dehydrogenase (NAD+)
MSGKDKVCIIGSGNWGSAIAKIVGINVRKNPNLFQDEVRMWMYEEDYEGKKLSEVFNTEHENKKYLPGIKIESNIVAVTDLLESVKDATVLVFVLPHQFLRRTCQQIKPVLAPNAKAISLIKGVDLNENGPILLSSIIHDSLNVDVSVLMGANIANEVAKDMFSEATIGYTDKQNGDLFLTLFNTPSFRCSCIQDIPGVEICGALKNVVALAAGFSDGLNLPGNTKAAILRIGLLEMKKFAQHFFEGVKTETFFESCGLADLFVTCTEGRNRKCAEAFVRTGKSFAQIEEDLLNGQKLQGTGTAEEVYKILVNKGIVSQYPLMSAVYDISFQGKPVHEMINALSAESKL